MLTLCDVISIVQTSGRISTTFRVSKCRTMAVNYIDYLHNITGTLWLTYHWYAMVNVLTFRGVSNTTYSSKFILIELG